MKVFTILSLSILILTSCQQKQSLTPAEVDIMPLELEWSDENPLSGEKLQFRYAKNIKYGHHSRNRFDVLVPNSETATPLVIYIHGGGFTIGDKNAAYIHADTIQKFLANGVAFATINYRYLEHGEKGVLSSLEDCKKFLQFIRNYARYFNVDPNKVASYGPSAGGGASLWLGTSDDMADPENTNPILRQSTRLSGVVALGTQATYDLVRWEEVFGEFNFSISDTSIFDKQTLFNFYNINSIDEVYKEEMRPYRQRIDMLEMMDASDAPIYVENRGKAIAPNDILDLYHHPYHAHALKEKATLVGLPHIVISEKTGLLDENDQGPVQFLLDQFNQ